LKATEAVEAAAAAEEMARECAAAHARGGRNHGGCYLVASVGAA